MLKYDRQSTVDSPHRQRSTHSEAPFGASLRLCAVALVLLALVIVGCGPRERPPRVIPKPPPPGPSAAALRMMMDGTVRTVALEDYVAGCVVAEMGAPRIDPTAAQRARELQAILCRSYAAASRNRHASDGFDVCATTHCQVYRAVPATETGRLAREAAADTRGLVLTYAGRTVRPLYHAACGGRTSAAQDVWPGNGEPWLVSLADGGCAREPGWVFEVEVSRLGAELALDERLRAATPLREVVVASRDAAGRAATVKLVGRTPVVLRGDHFRAAVMRAFGPRSLKSALFSIRRTATRLTFQGRGAGHGVGLCQAGALRMTSRGQTPENILRHYYPGTRLSHLD